MSDTRYGKNWQRLLNPRSVALIGASPNNISARYVHENMRRAGFSGDIYPINPRYEDVFGEKAYSSIAAAPVPDVAVVLLGRERVEDAVQQAVAADVGGIIVVTGGFRETGEPEWIEVEARMAAAVKAADIPMIGPNCLGVMALPCGAMMTLANYPWPLRRGSVALLMQSGGQLLAASRYVDYLGAGVRWGFSVGNGTTVSFSEILTAIRDDPELREIVMLIEEIGDWASFAKAATAAREAGKWMTALVIGRTQKAKQAAATHTGAVAVNHEIISAGLTQLGIRVAETLNGALGAAVLHSRFGDAGPGGLGVAGVSGGGSGLSADLAAARGIELPALSQRSAEAIHAVNPEIGANNPIDIIGGPLSVEPFRKVFEAFLKDENIGVGLYLPSQGVPEETLPGHIKVLENVADAAEAMKVPVVVSPVVYAPIPEGPHQRLLERRHVCVLPTIEEALASITIWRLDPLNLLELNRRRYQPFRDGGPAPPAEEEAAPQPHDEAALKDMLRAGGCAVPSSVSIARPADGQWQLAKIKGVRLPPFPVVLKGTGRAIFHKAAAGLVRLGIGDAGTLSSALEAMITLQAAGEVETFIVESHLPPGTDLMVSIIRNRLGTVILFGGGGAGAGKAGTTNWLVIDPSRDEMLKGARHILGRSGTEDQATALAGFAQKLVDIHAKQGFDLLEINPVRLLPSGEVYALDAVATQVEQGR